MFIGGNEVEQIVITDKNGDVLAVISDEEIVEHDSIYTAFEPDIYNKDDSAKKFMSAIERLCFEGGTDEEHRPEGAC